MDILGLTVSISYRLDILRVCLFDQVEPSVAGKASILDPVILRILSFNRLSQ